MVSQSCFTTILLSFLLLIIYIENHSSRALQAFIFDRLLPIGNRCLFLNIKRMILITILLKIIYLT